MYGDSINNTKRVVRNLCYEEIGKHALEYNDMVILDLDLASCYTSILLGLYKTLDISSFKSIYIPDHLFHRTLQLAIEGQGLWNFIRSEFERNGMGDVYTRRENLHVFIVLLILFIQWR
jgi:hypothetical protein